MYELSITKDIQYRCYNQRYFVLLVTVVSVAYVLSLFSGSHVASLICFVFFVFFWGGGVVVGFRYLVGMRYGESCVTQR